MEKYKKRSALSTASVVVDDGNRFVIEISNAEFSLKADEMAYYEKLLSDKGVEETRADAIIRGPLVVI